MSDSPQKEQRSVGRAIFHFFSGFGLATVLLVLLMLLTWLGTLEQVEFGLYATLKKYFHPEAFWIVPVINGKTLPLVLPGAYWVCTLLFINLLLGGIISARKGWNKVFVLLSHASMLFLFISAAVTHKYELRGNMAIGEGETSNVAEDYFNWVIEVTEMDGTKPAKVHVIDGGYLRDVGAGAVRTIRTPQLPFDVQVSRYLENTRPTEATELAPTEQEPIVDGYYLKQLVSDKQAEANRPGVHVKVLRRDNTTSEPFLLAAATFHPYTYTQDGKVYTIDMRKKLWVLPYSVRLEKFTAAFHPNTNRPEKFMSKITRLEAGREAPVLIQMNEPMRYRGLTFFQASYGPPDAKPGDPLYSVFEVVHNPADQWPRYCIYVASFALVGHFVMKLVIFLRASLTKSSNRKSPALPTA